jgi:hypothetical protein
VICWESEEEPGSSADSSSRYSAGKNSGMLFLVMVVRDLEEFGLSLEALDSLLEGSSWPSFSARFSIISKGVEVAWPSSARFLFLFAALACSLSCASRSLRFLRMMASCL